MGRDGLANFGGSQIFGGGRGVVNSGHKILTLLLGGLTFGGSLHSKFTV